MKKLILISFVFGVALSSCKKEEKLLPTTPCTDWWLGVTLNSGCTFEDINNDGEPDLLTCIDANGNVTTITCIDDLNGNCIPDCYEPFISNGQGNGGGNGTGGGNNPCTGWWQNLILVNGAVLVDIDNDGIPDILNYTDANGNVTTYTCIDDLNGDCIPDCFEQFVNNGGGNGTGGGNNPCTGWWQNLILVNGAVLVDIDNDGIPDILNYTDANGNVTTYTCIDDLNGDCIPDCFEQFVNNGGGNGTGGGNNPCTGWWQNLILVNGAVLVDIDNDGIPDILNYDDGNGNVSTYTCFDDLNGDCIPDCFEQFVL